MSDQNAVSYFVIHKGRRYEEEEPTTRVDVIVSLPGVASVEDFVRELDRIVAEVKRAY